MTLDNIIKILHVVPGQNNDSLVESLVKYSDIRIGILTLREFDTSLQNCCSQNGTYLGSLKIHQKVSLRSILAFRAEIKKLQPELVFLHGVEANFLGILTKIAFAPGTKFAGVRHHNSMYHNLTNAGIKVSIVDRLSNQLFPLIIAVSDSVRETLLREGCRSKKIRVIYNGIERRDEITKSPNDTIKRQEPKPTLRILAIGKLSRQKNYEGMFEILRLLTHSNIKFNLSILGTGDEKYRSKLQALAIELEISDKIDWLGWQAQVDDWFENSDLFLHTALDEACPLVLIEAMLHGVPVVSSNAGGCKDVLKSFYTGIDPKNFQGFNFAIQDVAHDLPQAKALANTISQIVKANFSAEVMAKNYCNLIRSV